MTRHLFTKPHDARSLDLAPRVEAALNNHPYGFTLTPYGFHVVGSDDDSYMPTGYAVGGVIRSLKFSAIPNPRSHVSRVERIATWLDCYWRFRDMLWATQGKDDVYVGGWLDSDTGTYYVDATVIFPLSAQAQAVAYARMQGEKAIGFFRDGEYVETVTV